MEANDLTAKIESIVDEAISSRKGLQRQAVFGTIAIVVMAIILPYFAYTNQLFSGVGNGDQDFVIYLVASGILMLGAFSFWVWCNNKFEKEFAISIMPILCNIAGGFSYNQQGYDSAEWILTQFELVTDVDQSNTAHHIKGNLGDVEFQFWNNTMIDVRHGKNQSNITKFSGYVIEIPKPKDIKNVLIRPVQSEFGRKVKAFFGDNGPKPFRSDITIPQSNNPDLALFLPTGENERAVRDWATPRIQKTKQILGLEAWFFGLLQHKEKLYLAIEDNTAPFNFNGLFSSKSELLRDAQKAMDEILLPIKIIQIWQK